MNIITFTAARTVNGVLNVGLGVYGIMEPVQVFTYLGHYNIPSNYGLNWVDPGVGNDYDWTTNYTILSLSYLIHGAQTVMGALQILSIPFSVLHVWDFLGL